MINFYTLERMYKTIAEDLKIENFGNEPINVFHNRIIYSAIGRWIMMLFADRDFEDEDLNQVSKSHVTISALDVLASYKKVDNELLSYFVDDKKLVNDIEYDGNVPTIDQLRKLSVKYSESERRWLAKLIEAYQSMYRSFPINPDLAFSFHLNPNQLQESFYRKIPYFYILDI